MLDWIQRIVKTDLRYLMKNGLLLTTSQTIVIIISMSFTIALGIFVSKQVIGEYKYLIAASSIMASFTFTGLGTALTQSISREDSQLLLKIFKTRLKLSFPVFLLACLVSFYYATQSNTLLAVGMIIVAFFTPLIESFKLANWQLLGEQKILRLALTNIATAGVPVVILILVSTTSPSTITLLSTYMLGYAGIGGVIFFLCVKILKKNKVPITPSKELNDTIQYGKKISYVNMIPSALQPLDQILIFQNVGAVELASYSYAVALPARIKGLLRQTSLIALPKFSQRSYEQIRKTLPHKIVAKLFLVLLIATTYSFFAPLIMGLIFPNFPESVIYSQILAFTLIGSITPDIGSALQAIKAKKTITTLAILSAATRLTLLTIGSIFFGVIGVIVASLASQSLQLLLYISLFFFRKPN